MIQMGNDELFGTLQLAVSPVIMLSGVGLLLLSINNRFGHLTDRARQLSAALSAASLDDRSRITSQMDILMRRAGIIRASIAFATVCMLLVAVLVICLFLGALLALDIGTVIVTVFILSMLALIASLLLFIADINLSMRALRLELPEA